MALLHSRGVNNAWQHGGLPFSQRNTAGGFDIPGSILYWTLDSSANMNGTAPYHLVPDCLIIVVVEEFRYLTGDSLITNTVQMQ